MINPGENERLAGLAKGGSKEAKEALIQRNQGHIISIVKRYLGKGVPYEDLVQEGIVGLLVAVDHYDPEDPSGAGFITYATMWIRNHVLKALETQGSSIRLPNWMYLDRRKLLRVKEELEDKTGKEATAEDLSEQIPGWGPLKVQNTLGAPTVTRSLDEHVGDDDTTGLLGDLIAGTDDTERVATDADFREALRAALDKLPTDQATVIQLYYVEEYSLYDIARMMKITSEAVRQRRLKGLRRLKRILVAYE